MQVYLRVGVRSVGLEILRCMACGQVSTFVETRRAFANCSLSAKADIRRPRRTVEDFNPMRGPASHYRPRIPFCQTPSLDKQGNRIMLNPCPERHGCTARTPFGATEQALSPARQSLQPRRGFRAISRAVQGMVCRAHGRPGMAGASCNRLDAGVNALAFQPIVWYNSFARE